MWCLVYVKYVNVLYLLCFIIWLIGLLCNVCIYISFCVIKLYSFYFWFLDSYVIYLWMKFDFKDYYVLVGNGNNYCFYFLLMFLGEFFLVFICLLFVKGVLFVFLGVIFILKLFRFCFFILIGDLFFGWYFFVVFFMVN